MKIPRQSYIPGAKNDGYIKADDIGLNKPAPNQQQQPKQESKKVWWNEKVIYRYGKLNSG